MANHAFTSVADSVIKYLRLEGRVHGDAWVTRFQHNNESYQCVIGSTENMTRQAARAAAIDFRAKVEAGWDPRLESKSFEQVFDLYLRNSQSSGKNKRKTQNRFNSLSAEFVSKRMKFITKAVVRAELAHHEARGLKPSTINRIKSLIQVVFSYAIKSGASFKNPCHGIDKRKENNVRTTRLPDEFMGAFINALDHDQDQMGAMAIKLMMFTGLRENNVISIKLSMISPCMTFIDIPKTKSGKPHRAIVPSFLQADLAKYVDTARKAQKEYLLFSSRSKTGHISSPRGVHARCVEVIRKLGFEGDLWRHDFRRTYADHVYIASNHDVLVVKEALGHATLDMTLRYLNQPKEAMRQAVEQAAERMLQLSKMAA